MGGSGSHRAPRGSEPGDAALVCLRCDWTGETDVRVRVGLDGSGLSDVSTGIGFLDHLLTLLARQSLIDLEIALRTNL